MMSATAKRMGIDNSLPAGREAKCVCAMELVVSVLNRVQRHFDHSVVVTSGYRCEELNKAVGGVPNSQHMLGEAVDFFVCATPIVEVFDYILDSVEFDQVILYKKKRIIHLSVRPLGCVRKTAIVR